MILLDFLAINSVRRRHQSINAGADVYKRQRLCHDSGGELDQIQFLLGHVSVQTTERYFGGRRRLRVAVNDKLGIEPG